MLDDVLLRLNIVSSLNLSFFFFEEKFWNRTDTHLLGVLDERIWIFTMG